MKCLIPLTFCKLCYRDPRPPGNNPGDLLFCNAFMDQTQILVLYLFLLGLQLLFQLRKLSVLELCRLVQIVFLLGVLDLAGRLSISSRRLESRSTDAFSFSHWAFWEAKVS